MFSIPSSLIAALFFVAGNAEALRTTPRRLSSEPIATFYPQTSVTDHNAIDLDQKDMENELGELSPFGFQNAKSIYQEGGHSKSYAELTLSSDTPLASRVTKGDAVIGGNDTTGAPVVGKAFADAAQGSTTLQVQYSTSTAQASYSDCQVGGLVDTVTAGCFATTGSITVGGATYEYTYDIDTNNDNGRTIQGFSTGADQSMRVNGEGAYFATFQKFFDYYGRFDYADAFVLAALDGDAITLNGKMFDFTSYSFTGKAEAAKKGAAYMNTAMYVIRELEDALDDCAVSLAKRNDDAVHALDEAVAFYTGSLEGTDGSGDGVQMYALADKRCENFRTCGEDGDQTVGGSKVNMEIFREFDRMQQNLNVGDCSNARKNKEAIEQKMFVPLVQGTLRYAWKQEYENSAGEKEEAEGATFAAAVLPVVAKCNEDDAAVIFNEMKPGEGFDVDFGAVKRAFERNYDCMNIKCEDVGGLWDDANESYMENASPCSTSSSGANVGLAVGLSIFGVVVVALAYLVIKRRRSSSRDLEFKGDNDTTTV